MCLGRWVITPRSPQGEVERKVQTAQSRVASVSWQSKDLVRVTETSRVASVETIKLMDRRLYCKRRAIVLSERSESKDNPPRCNPRHG
jgi:hypothetical protein